MLFTDSILNVQYFTFNYKHERGRGHLNAAARKILFLFNKTGPKKLTHCFIFWATCIPCDTPSLTLREEHRLRVFENRVLRGICGPKRDEVTGEWRKLHNKELRDFYSSPSIIRMIKSRRMRWAGHVARMGRRGTRIDYWWERDH
jgi:hypothetical protein